MAKPTFEKDLEKLEAIVESLEEGGLSLDDALKKFEEGMKLAQSCEKALSAAEKRIEILVKNADGSVSAEPFGDDVDDTPRGAGKVDSGDSADDEDDEGNDDSGTLLF